ncbi:hypothetical protein ACCO45_012759 [Purpureocillium lilacinum]|uniref:Uncharacterized protein n=1 Tax=Purpureocillium lilacinum TaxID=33203 RepID=A0ACC4D8W3_PURLI
MPRKTKLLVVAILSFAAVGSSATIFRSTFVPTLLDGEDFLYATSDVAIWSTVEPGIGISAASLATLRPFLQLLSYKIGLSSTGPSNPDWQQRNHAPRFRLGYIKSSSSPRVHLQTPRPDNTAATTIATETGS